MTASAEPVWLVNGSIADAAAVDRGSQFGDGLFETLAAVDGRVRFREQHLNRLAQGCRRLGLPEPDRATLAAELDDLVPTEGRAVLKILITAGTGGRGYARPDPCQPIRHLGRFPWPESIPPELAVIECQTRLAQQPLLAGIKHCNRLEQVLARREVAAAGADEGLLRDTADQVIEGVAANLFIVRDGRLLTPILDACGVDGIMRQWVMEVAAIPGYKAREARLALSDILSAEEVFMTNSLIGIRPVNRCQPATGKPSHWPVGPVTRQLQEELDQA